MCTEAVAAVFDLFTFPQVCITVKANFMLEKGLCCTELRNSAVPCSVISVQALQVLMTIITAWWPQ